MGIDYLEYVHHSFQYKKRTGGRDDKLVTRGINVFLMLLINFFPQTLLAVQGGYGSTQALIILKCLNK